MDTGQEIAIWNRAALSELGTGARPGDVALRDLLSAHNMIQNGGVAHCREVLSEDEMAKAASGFRFFGLDDVADVLLESQALGSSEQAAVDRLLDGGFDCLEERYAHLVPSDEVLVSRFREHLRKSPDDFADPGS